jgi:hypothetical protein
MIEISIWCDNTILVLVTIASFEFVIIKRVIIIVISFSVRVGDLVTINTILPFLIKPVNLKKANM